MGEFVMMVIVYAIIIGLILVCSAIYEKVHRSKEAKDFDTGTGENQSINIKNKI